MRKIKKIKFIVALSLTTLIFLVGVMVGQISIQLKSGEFSEIGRSLRLYLIGVETQTELAKKFLCEVDIFKLTEQKVELGRRVEFLEQRLGKNNREVLEWKKEYSLLLTRQLLLMEEFREKCKPDLNIIIFFYSNNETYLPISEKQGHILYHTYLRHPQSVVVYPFDVDLGLTVIATLEKIYNITTIPSTVINGKVYKGFVDFNTVERSLIL